MKMKEQLSENGSAQSSITVMPTHEEIAVRAYHLWEKTGKPQSRELECWLQAEAELRSEYHKFVGSVGVTLTIPRPKKRNSRTTGPLKLAKTKQRLPATE